MLRVSLFLPRVCRTTTILLGLHTARHEKCAMNQEDAMPGVGFGHLLLRAGHNPYQPDGLLE